MIKDLEMELAQKRKALAHDIATAKSEANMMLQSHGINPQGPGAMEEEGSEKMGASQTQSQNNFFQKKKENLEDKARILELIVSTIF